MAQNRNDQPEEHEESEYHFSDDEINYEIEEDPLKPANVATAKKEFKLTNFKRLIISVIVFFVLIFIVYKMLAPPTTTAPEISTIPTPTAGRQPITTQTIKKTNTLAVSQTPYQTTTTQTETTTGLPTQATNSPMNMPVVNERMLGETEAKIAAIAVENEKRIGQLTVEYNQKINDMTQQNKQLQDQIQLLSAKVGSMETQMNQLIQVLIRQGQTNNAEKTTSANDNNNASVEKTTIPYNVQAIIPGRAWLKAENGETVTVAEGDTIKGLGRVTKIDPYDGIVEVNTGSKAMSLSYGSNG